MEMKLVDENKVVSMRMKQFQCGYNEVVLMLQLIE
jgi:hypothetical protein